MGRQIKYLKKNKKKNQIEYLTTLLELLHLFRSKIKARLFRYSICKKKIKECFLLT